MTSMKHLVLGLVCERPGYGYDLGQRITERFAFLEVADGFVYSALDRLEKDGWVQELGTKVHGQTRRGSPRLMYGPTEAGLLEFARWMKKPTGLALVREETHIKLLLAKTRTDLECLLDHLQQLLVECLAELDQLSRSPTVPIDQLADPAFPWSSAASLIVVDGKATRIRATQDWIGRTAEVIETRLESMPADDGPEAAAT